MMKRVLITGGNGFIGRHTIKPLQEKGFEVHITSRSDNVLSKDIVVHQVNLLDLESSRKLIEKVRPTHLLHTAWYTENGLFWEATENVYWLQASLFLMSAFYAAGGQRFVGLGTCAEYDWDDGLCIENVTPEIPTSLYGKTKKAAYDCVRALSQKNDGAFAWARIFFPYGAYESPKRLVPQVITQLLQNKEVKCTHGRQIRDFLHVIDIGHALATILDSKVDGVINIGSGSAVTIREVVEQISTILEKKELVLFDAIPEPAYSPKKILADINRLTADINWTATLSISEGLLQTIVWWKERLNIK